MIEVTLIHRWNFFRLDGHDVCVCVCVCVCVKYIWAGVEAHADNPSTLGGQAG